MDFSGDNVIVKGHVLYLKDIRYFVETLIEEIKLLFSTRLFFGLDIVDINWLPGVVHEEPRNTSVGYSCFRDPHNAFLRHKDDLLQAILTHPRLRSHFYCIDQHGRITWRAGPCLAYLEDCHNAEMKLFSATQTSVGEPGRGTEVASHLIENISGGTIRNAFTMFQYFCMMGTFNKGSHMTEHDTHMMRVPHPEIGRLWMLYLTFVRPLILVWQKYFHGHQAAARAKSHLFFGLHRAVTSSELSRNLSYHTHRILGVEISISLWRHIVTWFLNHHSARFHNHLALSNRSALAIQMGHSETTHSLYAADSRLPSKIDYHVFFQTMRTSGIWHDLLGLTSKLLRDMSPLSHIPLLPSSRVDSDQLRFTPDHDSRYVLSKASIVDLTEEVKKTLIPEIIRINTQSRANDLASILDTVGFNLETPLSPVYPPAVTHFLHPSRLQDLRAFLGDKNAVFKHTQQALAVELIADKSLSILLVGPTGVFILNPATH